MDRRYILLIGVLVVALATGIVLLLDGTQSTSTPDKRQSSDTQTPTPTSTQTNSNGGKPPQAAEIDIYPEQYNQTGNQTIEVGVTITIRGHDSFEYKDVQLCLYDSEGSVLGQETLGTFKSPQSGEFRKQYSPSFTLPHRPHYIFVNHPQLRNDTRFEMDVRVWEGDGYAFAYSDPSQVLSRVNWPRTNQTGKCG